MSQKDGPVTLLVVDDEEPIRNAVQKYLVKQGFEVTAGGHGRGSPRNPPPPEDHGHDPGREPAGYERHRSRPADHGDRAHHRAPHAHRRERCHHRRPLHAARRTRLPHQADRPPHLGRAITGRSAAQSPPRRAQGQSMAEGGGRRSARPSVGRSRRTRSGSPSPLSRRWSTRSRPRTPISAGIRRESPISRR